MRVRRLQLILGIVLTVQTEIVTLAEQIPHLRKCCRKGEQLDENLTSCIQRVGHTVDTVSEEIYDFDDVDEVYWFPSKLLRNTYLIRYGQYQNKWNIVLNVINDSQLWNFTSDSEKCMGQRVKFRMNNATGDHRTVSTERYCFDVTGEEKLPTFVLLATVPEVYKCCSKGEQIDEWAEKCVRRKGRRVQDIKEEHFNIYNNRNELYWLPTRLQGSEMFVSYRRGKLLTDWRIVLRADDIRWRLTVPKNRLPHLVVNSPTPAGGMVWTPVHRFCFDAVAEGPLSPGVLVVDMLDMCSDPRHTRCVAKCCRPGEVLSVSGHCVPNAGADWLPAESPAGFYIPDKGIEASFTPYSLCEGSFYFKHNITRRKVYQKLHSRIEKHTFSDSYFCGDLVQQGESVRDVLAYCNVPASAVIYEKMRLLALPSSVLLLVALAAIWTRQAMWSSVHGRALACHAACLLMANIIQLNWFLSPSKDECFIYALHIYFFLIAGGFWLNVVSLNMAIRFGKVGSMRGAPRPSGRRFVLYSVYAWGSSAALTLFAASMYLYESQYVTHAHVIAPSFFETRTCFKEMTYTGSNTLGRRSNTGRKLGTLLYYYVPMTILVIANAICLISTTLRIRHLRRGNSVLQRTEVSNGNYNPTIAQSAILYVKLLLTAGVAELLVEGLAWAVGQARFKGRADSMPAVFADERRFVFGAVGSVLDLARALAVCWLSVGPAAQRCCRCSANRCRQTEQQREDDVAAESRTSTTTVVSESRL